MLNDLQHRQKLGLAREHFISTGLIDETVVREEVADSWQRCRAYGIDPRQYHCVGELDENEKASRLSGQADLVRASRPFLDSLFRIMKSLKIIILLLDEECVIVDSIGEGPGWKDSVKQKAVPGYSFHEKFSGTTAAGIAMNTGKPCQLLPEEHYCPFEIELICSAAPIHDPAQNLTGVLYVTAISDVAVKNPHIFGMVTAAAKAIEYNLSMMKETEKVVLANKFLKAAMAQISKGMMIFDSAGKLVNINMPAAKMFGFVENEVVGKVVDHLLPDTSIRELIASGRKNTFREVILSGNKRHNRYYASANNIFDDSRNCVGKALLFEQINKVKPLVHRMMGAVAEYQFSDIIGESRAIKRAVDLGLKAAECKSNVLILGESGTGKELFSQAIHNASDRHSGPFVAVSGYPDYCRLQGLPE